MTYQDTSAGTTIHVARWIFVALASLIGVTTFLLGRLVLRRLEQGKLDHVPVDCQIFVICAFMMGPPLLFLHGFRGFYMTVEIKADALQVSTISGAVRYCLSDVSRVQSEMVIQTDQAGNRTNINKLSVTKRDGSRREFELDWAGPEDYEKIAEVCDRRVNGHSYPQR